MKFQFWNLVFGIPDSKSDSEIFELNIKITNEIYKYIIFNIYII